MGSLKGLRCTEAQQAAILHHKGPALVIAGPGSGKTFVITHRIEHLIKILGVSPGKILVITFSKAAAGQMRERSLLLTPESCEARFGTFHSLFYEILRSERPGEGLAVLSATESRFVYREVIKGCGIETNDLCETARLLSGDISRYKGRLKLDEDFIPRSMETERFFRAYSLYGDMLKELGRIDFADMLKECHEILVRSGAVRKRWQERFGYILIDEFQDIDELQYACVKLLLGRDKNIFAVGDDDQSIYAFRGASPGIMLGFDKDFEGAVRIMLEDNHRCAGQIVRRSCALMEKAGDRFKKKIRIGVKEEGLAAAPAFESRREEWEFIRGKLEENRNLSAAILARTTKGAGYFAKRFEEYNMECSCRGRVGSFHSNFITDDICSYIRAALGEGGRECFLRIMNRPMRYIPRRMVGDTADIGSIIRLMEEDGRNTEEIRKLKRDLDVIASMKPYAAVSYIRRVAGYDRFLMGYAKERGCDADEYLGTAEEFLKTAASYESLRALLSATQEGKWERDGVGEMQKSVSCPVISTLHASKGLEYDMVFIVDVAEGIIPYKKAVGEGYVDEERRLMYVGMTRARRKLYICRLKKDKDRPLTESRFIREMGCIGCNARGR